MRPPRGKNTSHTYTSAHAKRVSYRTRGREFRIVSAFRRAARPQLSESELWTLALSDELTGLLNRRGLLFLAAQQLKLACRTGRGMLIFLFDLDGLKQINDHFGHSEGDAAFVRMSQILKGTFRDSDIVARFGGDEFLVLASETSEDDESAILRRLKEKINDSQLCGYRFSFSVGVARFDPANPCPLKELISRADRALYEQKRLPGLGNQPRSDRAVTRSSQTV